MTALAVLQQSRRIRNITDHRARRRILTGTATAVKSRTHHITRNRDRVKNAAHISDHITLRQKRRMDANR